MDRPTGRRRSKRTFFPFFYPEIVPRNSTVAQWFLQPQRCFKRRMLLVHVHVQGDSGGRIPRFVDSDLGSSPGWWGATARAGWRNIQNLSQPNQGIRPPESPCNGKIVATVWHGQFPDFVFVRAVRFINPIQSNLIICWRSPSWVGLTLIWVFHPS